MSGWKLACVIVVVALSGCSKATDETPEPQDASDTPDNDLPPELQYEPSYVSRTGGFVNGTSVSLYCDTFANSTVNIDPNATFSGNAHIHDEWNGQDEIVIFEGSVEDFVEAAQSGQTPVGIASTWFATPGATVFPGAGRATFKLEWDTPGVYRELGVQLPFSKITTRDSGVDHLLKFTQSGQEQSIDFALEDADPPHAERTHWKFKMNHANTVTDTAGYGVAQDIAYQTVFGADRETKITWTIHRTYDCLPLDPPHYEYWDGVNELPVFEATTDHAWQYLGATETGYFYGWHNGNGGIPGNGTVPPGTSQVMVEIDWKPDGDATAYPGLEYTSAAKPSTATTTEWTRLEPASESGNKRTYYIDVHPTETDDPYAKHSDWDFRFFMIDDSTDLADPPAGVMSGSVDWNVVAYR